MPSGAREARPCLEHVRRGGIEFDDLARTRNFAAESGHEDITGVIAGRGGGHKIASRKTGIRGALLGALPRGDVRKDVEQRRCPVVHRQDVVGGGVGHQLGTLTGDQYGVRIGIERLSVGVVGFVVGADGGDLMGTPRV